jgi:4-aminobutyrate aminotransferase-like enzyme
MTTAIQFEGEATSNRVRETVAKAEPKAMRTFTPSQAVFARSAGCFHWTPEGRRLYDFSSGVLVANLGHNPRSWFRRFCGYMGWRPEHLTGTGDGYFEAITLTAYNAVTPVETLAVERLLKSVRATDFGRNLDMVCWAASGSEAVQKALWACLNRNPERSLILATRYGFHGKKGLANAVTGSESDPERDPRVKFLSFPMAEIDDAAKYGEPIDLTSYRDELDALWKQHGSKIACLITEPYLGGGGSYHPPKEYLQLLERFCREHDILFILDEVQSNFGRTGRMYAFEKYEIAPDFVCLGKGLGNGVPVAAVVGRSDVLSLMKYGAASDTWSAAPIACASVVATLDEFESHDVLGHAATLSERFFAGLNRLKETGLVAKVRGEGMVFGIECAAAGGKPPEQVANAIVEACYRGEPGGDGIHLLGPLAGKVIRVSPPLTMTEAEAEASLGLLYRLVASLAERLGAVPAARR